ncbi:hypothetical protein CEE37_03335 [candidate division LCP-89 bacterium B3_LCP]|uniref:Sulfatase N-terminal domain-containing protein n=1 Tax=candidate division LCP-89 bacterium B3_LCP TaxID=2012998 RepID=A0A532V3A9_UNCL8|nr:MAG: hypothetical protein CEE37_03335 [candidate division LCP-89 bacterium B3_LCP]
MNDDQLQSPLGTFTFSFFAGSIGGIVAGFFEILLISDFGASLANFSGLLFAVLAYGILGGVIGMGKNIVAQVMPFHRERRKSRRYLGAFITAASTSAVLFLILFFRAFRDFHAERVRYFEPTGLLTIVVLLVGIFLLMLIMRLIFAGPLRSLLNLVLKPAGYTVLILCLLAAGFILDFTLAQDTEKVSSQYSPVNQAELNDKPNVILIMVDTLRRDRVGCYGDSNTVSTPNIDALASDGVIYDQHYAQATHTKPSTASLLTSRYPTGHGAVHKNQALPGGVTTLAEVCHDAGYYCGGIVTNINLAPIYNFQQGFHEYTYLPPKFFFGANEAASRLVVYGVLRLVRMKLVKSKYVYHFYRSGETVNGYFDDFLTRNGDQKFFLFLHYMDPHDPYFEHPYSGFGYARAAMPNPDPKFAEPFKDFYRQDVEYLDQWIGTLQEKLKSLDLYDNCMIVFTSDHGEEFYEHGGWWHGTTLHEEQIRVPLIIKKAGTVIGDSLHTGLTHSVDVAPTILTTIGLGVPPEMRGRDLFAVDVPENFIPEVFAEADHEGNVVQMFRSGSWKYLQTNPDNPRKRPPQQLFYLNDDPGELNNLVDVEHSKTSEMQLLLKAKYQEVLAGMVGSAETEMDQATQERLRALGYTQ